MLFCKRTSFICRGKYDAHVTFFTTHFSQSVWVSNAHFKAFQTADTMIHV